MPNPGRSATESGQHGSGDLRAPWGVGRSVGRTIYRQRGDDRAKGDELIGLMDTPELARQVVDAVNALRVDSRQAPSSSQAGSSTHHDCCPHCTARTGSCARCGVRDAADGKLLCGQCDGEVTAEVEQDRAVRALREEGQ